jgi:hypothetical protein
MKHFLSPSAAGIFSNLALFCTKVIPIYDQAIQDYHITDSISAVIYNPFPEDSIERLLYSKCWVDTVQWHVEDEIRNPDIDPAGALRLKRSIDGLNQQRTDIVESMDSFFLGLFSEVRAMTSARVNTESPAWALDRLSILGLKIYHMDLETKRKNVTQDHFRRCVYKLEILHEQQKDLSLSINELLLDISSGRKRMKAYRQMKMYNDAELNPVLYKSK